MITGNHKNELRKTFYNPEYAFCEFYVNEDGTKRPNEWTPPLHKISTNDIELLWLYWERAEIEYNSIKYNLDSVLPDTSDEAKKHVSKQVNLTDEDKRIEAHSLMMSRQSAIDAYYAYKEYLQGIRGKIQIAQRGKEAPDLPDFTDYEYDAYYLPKPPTTTTTTTKSRTAKRISGANLARCLARIYTEPEMKVMYKVNTEIFATAAIRFEVNERTLETAFYNALSEGITDPKLVSNFEKMLIEVRTTMLQKTTKDYDS